MESIVLASWRLLFLLSESKAFSLTWYTLALKSGSMTESEPASELKLAS